MPTIINKKIINDMNVCGKNYIPFIFIIDFELKKPIIHKLYDIDSKDIKYCFKNNTNIECIYPKSTAMKITNKAVSFDNYKKSFNFVKQHINSGNSYLVNLTKPALIETEHTFDEIFFKSKAKYKMKYKDEFVFFSPETFVKIEFGKISSFPMKGTIDASIENAEQVILNDKKEIAEHNTIVDLIRNDLSLVAKNVIVNKFRYIDKIKTSEKTLLQVSSKIVGDLPKNYNEIIGDIIFKLLPAGSISGAPKKRTIEIIQQAENSNRGYYTGVAGYFDGRNLDSCVIIRYMEKNDNKIYYKSGGGITSLSDLDKEYSELMDKIYIPV